MLLVLQKTGSPCQHVKLAFKQHCTCWKTKKKKKNKESIATFFFVPSILLKLILFKQDMDQIGTCIKRHVLMS